MKWMLFVDGENLTIRGQVVASEAKLVLTEGDSFRRDKFLWLPRLMGYSNIYTDGRLGFDTYALRAMYYSSAVGSEEVITETRNALNHIGFEPHVFKKTRTDQKSKGVDIELTKDMLSHAFRQNYEAAVLVAGDGDYVPLVEEVKRLGKIVVVSFFIKQGLNPELKLAADHFNDLTNTFARYWTVYP